MKVIFVTRFLLLVFDRAGEREKEREKIAVNSGH
jgi:hypothetical protein